MISKWIELNSTIKIKEIGAFNFNDEIFHDQSGEAVFYKN